MILGVNGFEFVSLLISVPLKRDTNDDPYSINFKISWCKIYFHNGDNGIYVVIILIQVFSNAL